MLVRRDLNPKRAQSVKQNSPVDCFVDLRCVDGYRMRSIGSSSREDAKGDFIPSSGPKNSTCFDKSNFFIHCESNGISSAVRLYIIKGGVFMALGAFMLLIEFLLGLTFGLRFIGWSIYPLVVLFLFGGLLIYFAINNAAREIMERKLFF